MGLLRVIHEGPAYTKALFQGPTGSGKTTTAVRFACQIRKHFGLSKPIAFFDTETGSDYVAGLITELSGGVEPLRVKSRAFEDLMTVVDECEKGAAEICVVDSVSHVWKEIQAAYMAKVNEGRYSPKTRMDIGDIMRVKELWQPWPDRFLSSKVHIIVCGREGIEWGHEEDEETGRKELVATGKKAQVETNFAYEASLIVSMAIRQEMEATVVKKAKGKGGGDKRTRRSRKLVNVATVIKDRFAVIQGQSWDYPTGEEFMPFLKRLSPPDRNGTTDMRVKTALPVDRQGKDTRTQDRTIDCELIENALVEVFPGTGAKDKTAKLAILKAVFGTSSWTEITERLSLARLHLGRRILEQTMKRIAANEDTALSFDDVLKAAVEGGRRAVESIDAPIAGMEALGEPVAAGAQTN